MRTEVYTTKTYHDSFDPIRAVRTKDYSYIENYAARPLLDLPLDIADSAPGIAVAPFIGGRRPARELYDLTMIPPNRTTCSGRTRRTSPRRSPTTSRCCLHDWRQKTNDVIPSEFAGTRISERYTETYLRIHGRVLASRSAIAAERGIEDERQLGALWRHSAYLVLASQRSGSTLLVESPQGHRCGRRAR